MAATIKKDHGIQTTITKGSNGIFDVFVDGTMVFSKYKVSRFPNPGEVEEKIAELVSGK